MSYDLDSASDWVPPTPSIAPSNRKDLEAIMMLLELAAIYLTDGPDSSFTVEQLLAQARDLGGNEIQLDEIDVKIVLGKAGFLKKGPGKLLRFK